MAQSQFELLIRLFAESKSDVVVIGGLAVILHGGDQVTQDADFAFARQKENARLIASALAPYRPRPVDWPEGLPIIWDERIVMNSTILTLESDLGRVDLLAEPAGAPPYPELKAKALLVDLEGVKVYVACIEDLIAMKLASGRPKDLAHVAELESILRLRGTEE